MSGRDILGKKIELSVSTGDLMFNCKKLAETLRRCGVESNITPNYSVTRREDSINSEVGCKVELHNIDPKEIEKRVWGPLKRAHNFDCGHLWIQNQFSGCVYDYFNNKIDIK